MLAETHADMLQDALDDSQLSTILGELSCPAASTLHRAFLSQNAASWTSQPRTHEETLLQ